LGQPQPWGIQAVKAPQAWALGYQGQGVRVLVLDTGVDKNHPVLKNQFRAGKFFLGKDSQLENVDDQPEVRPEESIRELTKLPYDYFDDVGHGTHVSGTILAEAQESGFAGVAPKSELYVGKICDLQGCSNIGEIQGLDWGIENKVRVVNLSLGGPNGTRGEKMAMQKAERAGLIIVAASGNDGVPRISYPGAYANSIAVGAVDNSLNKASFSQWGNELDVMAPGVGVLSSVPLGTAKASKVYVSGISDKDSSPLEILSKTFFDSPLVENNLNLELVDFGVGFLSSQNLQGKVAMIDRGSVTFDVMVKNAVRLGAKAALVVNNEAGLFEGSIDPHNNGMKLSPIPVFMIEKSSGEKIRQALIQGRNIQIEMKTLAADYEEYDGTSMATPHATGVVALMLSARPELTPVQVRQLLNQSCVEIPGETPFKVGHGLIQSDKAVVSSKELMPATP
jgi:subtilisin family serine protease